jgi:hypothetical protein
MRGNAHVRFGGAGRGNGSLERAIPRPGPTLRTARRSPSAEDGTCDEPEHGMPRGTRPDRYIR